MKIFVFITTILGLSIVLQASNSFSLDYTDMRNVSRWRYSYTKLDINGNDLSDSVLSWSMVRDNVTGLIWEVKHNADGVANYSDPHDADNEYTWYDSNPITNGGNPGTPANGADTEDFIGQLNDAGFGAHDDWRLPSISELESLVYDGAMFPAISLSYFMPSEDAYWSSSTSSYFPNEAKFVDFDFGDTYDWTKAGKCWARAVRSVLGITAFTVTPHLGTAPLRVLLSCSAVDLNGGEIIQYLWDFNGDELIDSISSTGEGCQTYSNSGNYLVTCTVVNGQGDKLRSNPIAITVLDADNPLDIDNDGDGFTENQGDCNDNNITIYPGAVEICDDDVDQDCSGSDLACPVGYTPGPYNYYLPYYHSSANNDWTGLGLINRNKTVIAELQIVVYDSNGNMLVTEDKTIPAYGQDSFSVAPQINSNGWMCVNSHQQLSGLAFLGTEGISPLMADIPFVSELSSCMILPHVAQDDTWDTTILMCNPSNESATVNLIYIDKSGKEQGTQSYVIPSLGSGKYPLSTVFSGEVTLTGRVEIDSSNGIAVFALYSDIKNGGTRFAGINADNCE